MKLLKLILQKICRFLELCQIKEELDFYPDVIEDLHATPEQDEETDRYEDVIEDIGIVPESEK